MDHPPTMHTVCGSDLGIDRGEQLVCTGSSHFAGYHTGLAVTEDGALPVRKCYHTHINIMYDIYIITTHNLVVLLSMQFVCSVKM